MCFSKVHISYSAAHATGYGTGRDGFFPIPNLRDGMRDGTG
jgi:hypothetical protein